MKEEERIREGFRKMMQPSAQVLTGKIISVDEDALTCNVDLLDGRKRFGVSLQSSASPGDDGLIVYPQVDSPCIIAQVAMGNNYTLINADHIDKLRVKIGEQTLEMTDQGFEFNGGNKGAMVVIAELVSKLNRLEQAMSNHQHAYVSPGGPAITTTNGTQLVTPQTTINDLANNDIKQ